MTTSASIPCLDPSVSSGEIRRVVPRTDADDPLTRRTRAIWTAGDFGRIATGFADGAADFVARLGLAPGERVLDVACGTGNLTLPAARAGARVTGLDIAPNLLAMARTQAESEGLSIAFDEGDAEALPYADGAFDTAITMFGVMFAPRPLGAAAELVRVVRPGGRIAMANWMPEGFIGEMLAAQSDLVPPPAGVPSPVRWGDPAEVQARFNGRVRRMTATPRTIGLRYPLTPAGVVELFRTYYGPSVKTFEALDAEGRAILRERLERLWDARNLSANGATHVEAEYLEVHIEVA